jgi:hypothetical protein
VTTTTGGRVAVCVEESGSLVFCPSLLMGRRILAAP